MVPEWKYNHAGRVCGPITAEELVHLYRTDRLMPDDLVKGPGMKAWIPAGKADLFLAALANDSSQPRAVSIPVAPVVSSSADLSSAAPVAQVVNHPRHPPAPADSDESAPSTQAGRKRKLLLGFAGLLLLMSVGMLAGIVYLLRLDNPSPSAVPARPSATRPPLRPPPTLPRPPIASAPRPTPQEDEDGFSHVLGRTSAKRILYVVDASSSMQRSFDFVRAELLRNIQALTPAQSFHIILFGGAKMQENSPPHLTPATHQAKQEAERFLLGVVVRGETDPLPALARAFQVTTPKGEKAELVYILTDGDFPEDAVKRIASFNRDKKVKINTIALTSEAGHKQLETIARQNGGQFKFVSQSEMEQ